MSENKLPPFKERTFIQHIGRLMEIVGGLSSFISILGIYEFIREGVFRNF
jgi:hypothetical protein